MRSVKEEASCRTEQAIDLISAVKELHGLSSQELSKLIRDSENNILHCTTENGSSVQIDAEKLARYLPLHLIAMLISSERDEAFLRHLLCGFRLLHSLCDLASRQPRLEQILLDDVKVSEQLLDLVFYLLIVLGGYRQEHHTSSYTVLLHSALVACSLYLLTGCISSQWQELAQVLLAHPRVDIFMDAAFGAVCVDIKLLQIRLSAQHTDSCSKSSPSADEILDHLCQHCEASLQFLLSLCQQKLFREHLVKNKELCGKGGVLWLAQLVTKLNVSPSSKQSTVVASISRMKAKVLSILLHLCEAESVSYLDVVASTPRGLDLAKSVALEVLEVLKTMVGRDLKELKSLSNKTYPRGLLQLNAMRLADIFSDDSNFRSYIMIYSTEILTAIFSLPHGEFLSCWCSSNLPVWEEDATLEYDPSMAAGWVLDLYSSSDLLVVRNSESIFIPCNIPRASYAHQRTSLLVKVIANLHCFAPDICKEEKDTFLNKFLQCLQKERPRLPDGFSLISDAEKAAVVSRNLRSLLSHAESLIPSFLIEEDVQLLRVFINQLEPLIIPRELEKNRVQERKFEGSISWEKLSKLNTSEHNQEAQSAVEGSSPLHRKVSPDPNNRNGDLKEGMSENSALQEVDPSFCVRGNSVNGADVVRPDKRRDNNGKNGSGAARGLREIERETQNVETSGSDSSSTRGKNCIDQMDCVEYQKSSEQVDESGLGGVQQDEKVQTIQCEEKQRRKRKRTIMNDNQVALMEKALLDEPDMQRHASSVRIWAEKLSEHGSEVTPSQLKNWLNNRKARLARQAKDFRAPSEGDSVYTEKRVGPGIVPQYDSPESPVEDVDVPLTARGNRQSEIGGGSTLRISSNENLGTAHAEINDSVAAAELLAQCETGQYVVLLDAQGEEVGKGKVYQVQGKWQGMNLEESKKCVVDIIELKGERWARLTHPCEATGTSYDQAEKSLGEMRVMWDSNKIFRFQPR
ncbi:hypothetical protein LguiA_011439 [Lonicera macranthoides]